MALITEEDVRKLMQDGVFSRNHEYHVDKSTILTPSARGYLAENAVSIVKDKSSKSNLNNKSNLSKVNKANDTSGINRINTVNGINRTAEIDRADRIDTLVGSPGYRSIFGGSFQEKPEYMTHLHSDMLVFKDHPRIKLRGAIDYLESEIIIVQVIAERMGKHTLTKDLEEIMGFLGKIIQCEIKEEALGDFMLQGLDEAALRDYSHHPSKYFGMKHFLPNYEKGEITAYLNKLRTLARKSELIAYDAFKDIYGRVERVDIMQAFNRLSSLFWIMMFKELTGKYEK